MPGDLDGRMEPQARRQRTRKVGAVLGRRLPSAGDWFHDRNGVGGKTGMVIPITRPGPADHCLHHLWSCDTVLPLQIGDSNKKARSQGPGPGDGDEFSKALKGAGGKSAGAVSESVLARS